MKFFRVYLFLIIAFVFSTCGADEPGPSPTNYQFGDWLIPQEEIFDGGPGKDGIPALENPKMTNAAEATYLSDNDLIVGALVNGEPRAYPHIILDWHEIINDKVGDQIYTINYCPLTGTAMNWKRKINGQVNTFGVSGLLYNSNLILYDRGTDSNWSQMTGISVNGRYIGRGAELLPVLETTWKTWKEMYPETYVVSLNTGFDRPYGNYPYVSNQTKEDYRESPFLIFPITNDDDRLHRKERVIGVKIGDESRAFRFEDFEGNTIVRTTIMEGQQLVIIGNASKNFLSVFHASLEDEPLSFTALDESELPLVMKDNLGNTWNIFGRAVSGPNFGSELRLTESYIGYWFAWAAFNPDIEIIDF